MAVNLARVESWFAAGVHHFEELLPPIRTEAKPYQNSASKLLDYKYLPLVPTVLGNCTKMKS